MQYFDFITMEIIKCLEPFYTMFGTLQSKNKTNRTIKIVERVKQVPKI